MPRAKHKFTMRLAGGCRCCPLTAYSWQRGAKLSKRHGALGVDAYRDEALPEAMRNYLARLGWSHGDDEIFTTEQLVTWFGLDAIGKSPARFDMTKLENLNGHHIRRMMTAPSPLYLRRSPN